MAISGRQYTNRPVVLTGHIGGQDVLPSAIASEEAFGAAVVVIDQLISPAAIASGEAFGSHAVFPDQFISVTGIASEEAFGAASVRYIISPTAIASAEYFNAPTITLGSQFVLRPPSIQETPMADNILHKRFGIHRGISIIKRSDGTYYSTRYPAQTEVEESLATYMGGHIYVVSKTVRDELVAAGFGAYVTLEDAA
jgi:hypothetical protein